MRPFTEMDACTQCSELSDDIISLHSTCGFTEIRDSPPGGKTYGARRGTRTHTRTHAHTHTQILTDVFETKRRDDTVAGGQQCVQICVCVYVCVSVCKCLLVCVCVCVFVYQALFTLNRDLVPSVGWRNLFVPDRQSAEVRLQNSMALNQIT